MDAGRAWSKKKEKAWGERKLAELEDEENNNEEIKLNEDEFKDIQIEAENAVLGREEAEGIYPEDYLEPEELAALEEEDGSSDNDYSKISLLRALEWERNPSAFVRIQY